MEEFLLDTEIGFKAVVGLVVPEGMLSLALDNDIADRLNNEMGPLVNEQAVKYLNRLSDFFFVLARIAMVG